MIPKIETSLPDFSDPEVFRSLEKQSYTGTLDYADFPPVEYQYFAELRAIYYAFKFEDLGKSEAERRKKRLYSRYENERHKADLARQAIQKWNERIRMSDQLRSWISKSSDIVEKYRLAVQCIGAMTGDEVFTRTEIEKLESGKENQT
ncbi:MAG: hypothetical protein K2H29_07370 [Oscillospiraceae bacterium]|nr:hypothetical protein [Oscillospiraceae bacterium]